MLFMILDFQSIMHQVIARREAAIDSSGHGEDPRTGESCFFDSVERSRVHLLAMRDGQATDPVRWAPGHDTAAAHRGASPPVFSLSTSKTDEYSLHGAAWGTRQATEGHEDGRPVRVCDDRSESYLTRCDAVTEWLGGADGSHGRGSADYESGRGRLASEPPGGGRGDLVRGVRRGGVTATEGGGGGIAERGCSRDGGRDVIGVLSPGGNGHSTGPSGGWVTSLPSVSLPRYRFPIKRDLRPHSRRSPSQLHASNARPAGAPRPRSDSTTSGRAGRLGGRRGRGPGT